MFFRLVRHKGLQLLFEKLKIRHVGLKNDFQTMKEASAERRMPKFRGSKKK